MRKFILPKGLLLGLFVILAILGGIQFGVNKWILYDTKVGQMVCETHEIDKSGSRYLKLNITCAGKETSTKDAAVVLSWIRNPGPLNCTLYELGNVSCEPREAPQ